jgi:hypothetical protein
VALLREKVVLMFRLHWVRLVVVAFVAGFAPGRASAHDLAVSFEDCVESIGVTLAPTEAVREHVPESYLLPGDGAPVTPLVVRTAHCDEVRVGKHRTGAANIVQIGAFLISPDGTGDVNNYLFWYQTTNVQLALVLRLFFDLDAQFVPRIDYEVGEVDENGQADFSVRVRAPGSPRFSLSGSVVPAGFPATNFVANWWQESRVGTVKLSTLVPSGVIGGAALVLDTPTSKLAEVLGGSTASFPIIEQFNSFATAPMTITVD